MTLSAESVSYLLATDGRAEKFLSPSVAREKVVRQVITLLPRSPGKDSLNFTKVINLGEQWVRLALLYDLEACLSRNTAAEAVERAAVKLMHEKLAALELKVTNLRRLLYDTQRSAEVLRRLFAEKGDAVSSFTRGGLGVNGLMALEPAVFILAVSP